MATAPTVTLPIKADPSHVIGVIDIIVKHLTALREELAATDAAEHKDAVRYWVLMAEELLKDHELVWPSCLRLIRSGDEGRSPAYPGARWVYVEDADASPALDGMNVELEFMRTSGDVPVITGRRVMT